MNNARLYRTTALALSFAVSLSAAPAVLAQTTQSTTPTAAASDTTEVVVTGQRASRRSRLDTLAPVDVVTANSLAAQGNSELAQGLSRVAPSLNFPRPAGTDGTDNIRPATLRGLSPDETLVLVDGKRQHASALVNINGSAGRGSSAVDLNAIPEAALDRIEVLRDGASAEYGSDAIAGVVNLHLREARKGGNVEASYGQYDTDIKAANSERHAHDGATTDVNGWIGLPLGSDGFVTLSGDLKKRNPTSRGDIDSTVTPVTVTSRYGDPEQKVASVFVNAGKPINDSWKAYGSAGYTDNDSKSAAFFRHSYSASNVAALYPNGFLPIINAKSKDYSITGGIKGEAAGWTQDYSLTYGGNELKYYTLNSENPTYGAASQTSFYDGEMKYDQTVFNADISKPFNFGWHAPVTLAFGLEARHETYKITAGELESYGAGPLVSSSISAGAQGFGGFRPDNAVDKSRDNVGVYADAATNLTDKFSVDGAIRYENYSDFGSNVSGKLAGRYDFTPNFAIRGAVESGFRAPSLQQQYFTSTASVVSNGSVVETGTFPATSAVATALGGQQLKAEKATSESLGAVWHKGPFELTVDGYHIRISDRIVLSENLSGSAITPLLAPYGVTAARFFMNGITSSTSGVDIVGNYRIPTEHYGRFNLSLAWNNTNTVIDKLPTNNVLASVSPAPVLFARIRQYILTNSSPENKGTFAVDWNKDAWSVTTRATYYGDVIDANATNPANDIHTGKKTLVDLEGSYRFATGTRLTIGADNLFDVYPNKTPAALNTTSGNGVGALAFDRFSPFGFNGRYLYAKVSQSF
jgi:iron complex outermembrane receptor protein